MECKNCQQGNVLVENIITVSRDMAIDAGDLSLEGASWHWGNEWVACECCQGEWQDCPACTAMGNLTQLAADGEPLIPKEKESIVRRVVYLRWQVGVRRR